MQPTTLADRRTEVSPNPEPGPVYVGLHWLYRRVTTLKQAQAAKLVHRYRDGQMHDPFDPDSIPPAQLERLVRDGELYLLWAQRVTTPCEISAQWPLAAELRTRAVHAQRQGFGRRRPGINPEED